MLWVVVDARNPVSVVTGPSNIRSFFYFYLARLLYTVHMDATARLALFPKLTRVVILLSCILVLFCHPCSCSHFMAALYSTPSYALLWYVLEPVKLDSRSYTIHSDDIGSTQEIVV